MKYYLSEDHIYHVLPGLRKLDDPCDEYCNADSTQSSEDKYVHGRDDEKSEHEKANTMFADVCTVEDTYLESLEVSSSCANHIRYVEVN